MPIKFTTNSTSWLRGTELIVCIIVAFAAPISFGQTTGQPAASTFKELNRFGSSLRATQQNQRDDQTKLDRPDRLRPKPDVNSRQSNGPVDNERIDSIYDRIDLLEQLMEDENAAAAKTKRLEWEQAQRAHNAALPGAINESVEKTGVAADSSKSGNNSEPESPIGDPESASVDTPTQIFGKSVVAEPVNSFELANSLFLTGNIAASRKSYQVRLEKGAESEEEAWLMCLIGCCYRLEGNFAKAEAMFRDVTNKNQESYPVDYSKWCLQYLEQRRATLEQFKALEAEIDSILKELPNND